jgi:N-acyl-D-amino-acid deacylase
MCSFSPAPIAPGRAEAVRGWAGGIGATVDLQWETFGQYLDALRSVRPSINVAHFVGHGALRLATVGPENRPVAPGDLDAMQRRLDEAMDAGAWGFSTGLVYPPSAYAGTEELIRLARGMARRGGLYFSHVRGESAMVEDSIREAIRIGEEAGVGVQIAHVKVSGRENWGKMDAVLRLIDEARARGVDVSGDAYPYHAGSTKMDNLLPAWVHDGGLPRLLERIGDPATRRRILDECVVDGERWGTVSQGRIGFDEIMIATCRRHELEGLSLAALARQTGKPPAEAMMDLLLEERATVGMVSFSQNLDNVAKALAHPAIMIGSDSIGLSEGMGPKHGKPHPRMYGTFPRVLGEYARDRRLLSLETAVHKMTGMPARRLGLKRRGLLEPGYAADIAVFDPAAVKDEATFQEPHQYAGGIPYVVVNGAVVVDAGRMRAAGTGRVLTPERGGAP